MANDADPRVPSEKIAEARALWSIALHYIGFSAAASVYTGNAPATVAGNGFRAAQLLARAYFRLVRAIWTGSTIADRTDTPGGYTSFRELYSDFETLAYRSIPRSRHREVRQRVVRAAHNQAAAFKDLFPMDEDEDTIFDFVDGDRELAENNSEFSPQDGDDYAADLTDDRDWGDEKDIAVERLEQAEQHLRDVEEQERAMKAELEQRIKHFEKLQEQYDKQARKAEREAGEAETRRRYRQRKDAKALSKRRAKSAGAAIKAVEQGARSEIASLTTKDKRSKGYVRVIRSPRPCGFCLMLASRGISGGAYRSAATALAFWHENCMCEAEPIFSIDQYFKDPAFANNRALFKMWKDIVGNRGRGGFNDWRTHFRQKIDAGQDFSEIISENARKHS